MLDRLERQRVVVHGKHLACAIGGVGNEAFRVTVLGTEYERSASPGSTVSVAAPRSPAAWAIESTPARERIDDRKVEIHSGLDQPRGNDAAGPPFRELLPDPGEHLCPMFGTHQGAQMEMAVPVRADGFEQPSGRGRVY